MSNLSHKKPFLHGLDLPSWDLPQEPSHITGEIQRSADSSAITQRFLEISESAGRGEQSGKASVTFLQGKIQHLKRAGLRHSTEVKSLALLVADSVRICLFPTLHVPLKFTSDSF